MDTLYKEEMKSPNFDLEREAGVSFRSWVITGCIVLFSLSTSCIGLEVIKGASFQDSSFLIPLGLTIGFIVTGYGAVFIGSHLEELSDRFRLH
jgi:hypothetical protein